METMTIRQALEITMKNLGEIAVPRMYNEQIGVPIDQAIHNIQLCIEAIDKTDKEMTEKAKQAEDEPEIEILGADEDGNAETE